MKDKDKGGVKISMGELLSFFPGKENPTEEEMDEVIHQVAEYMKKKQKEQALAEAEACNVENEAENVENS